VEKETWEATWEVERVRIEGEVSGKIGKLVEEHNLRISQLVGERQQKEMEVSAWWW